MIICLFLVAVRDKICGCCTIILKAKTIKSPLFDLVIENENVIICCVISNKMFSVKQNDMLSLYMLFIFSEILKYFSFKDHSIPREKDSKKN